MLHSNALISLYIFKGQHLNLLTFFIFSEKAEESKTTYFTKVTVDKVALSLYQSVMKNSSVDNR